MTSTINSPTPKSTEALAGKLGANLTGGEVIELVSDIGGGKTTFVRGLVRGLGSQDTVASPTFTISKVYKTHDLEIYHFDFYRLQEPGIIANELVEVAGEPNIITIIEWADVVQHVLPEKRLTITISVKADDTRHFHFSYPEELAYCMKGLRT